MLLRLIAPKWLQEDYPNLPKVIEKDLTEEERQKYNAEGYNIYLTPNTASDPTPGKPVDGSQIDTFNCVFVDYDCKSGNYEDKDAFLAAAGALAPPVSLAVDSGNGIHLYWFVSDLDAMSYLRLSRRMMRLLRTDEAVGQIFQLMRLPGSLNTKEKGNFKPCEILLNQNEVSYTCDQLDGLLPKITAQDEAYCQQHFAKTYKIQGEINIDDKIPDKFGKLLRESSEAKEIWSGNLDDRSKGDYRLGHLMFASGFSRREALSVLVNSAKALARAPVHRVGYAENIVGKIWTYELEPDTGKALSSSVKDILAKGGDNLKGTRFPCHPLLDNTVHGFRLGQVIGLVAGSGVGKTSMAINLFRWFTERNPEHDHMFVSLEQPAHEIAERWRTVCQGDDRLHDKVHIISNYDDTGAFRHLSLDDIKEYLLQFKKDTGKSIGTVVIDHIGALKTKTKDGQNQGIIDICHKMKAFAIETDTMVIMQSQAPREKAGIGDLELNKDSAYGTVFFESYVDWLLCIWQPLKRVYSNGAPTTMAFKFAKIRHKKQGRDVIQEDERYRLFFDPETEQLREMTEGEEKSFDYWNIQATNARSADRKTDVISYKSMKVNKEAQDGKVHSNQDSSGDGKPPKLLN